MSRSRILLAFFLALFLGAAQAPEPVPLPAPPGKEEERRLPDGRSVDNERAKAAYRSSLEDAQKLVRTAEELKAEIEKNDRYVVSVTAIRKTEEIEKLAKKIRGRMKQL